VSQRAPTPALTFLEPTKLAPRGTLVVIPGRGEQPEVYRRFGTRIAVDAYRVHVVDDPTVDEGRVRRQVAEASAGAVGPVVLAGLDAGALFAARLATDGAHVDALILAGLPSSDQAASSFASWEEELDVRTSCPTHRRHISGDLITAGALSGPIPAQWSDPAALARVGKPILAIHGREDPINALEAARESYAAAPHVELVAVAGAHHDVLNDQSHRTVAATIILWLERLRAGDDLAPIASLQPTAVTVG
jgi:pimeloyl-ACP methyl ester carboxylesterase